jgi:hypothetical protein
VISQKSAALNCDVLRKAKAIFMTDLIKKVINENVEKGGPRINNNNNNNREP